LRRRKALASREGFFLSHTTATAWATASGQHIDGWSEAVIEHIRELERVED
jgi:hypothetical protein